MPFFGDLIFTSVAGWFFRKLLKFLYRFIVSRYIPSFIDELRIHTKDCSSILDIGCGNSSPVKWLPKKIYKVGIDAYKPCIENSRKLKIHDKYYQMDISDIGLKIKPKTFDCVVALDVIEHLNKEEGLKLIAAMEKIACKKIIIFTPNGFLPQSAHDNNPFQVHRSGWTCNEMESLGFKVIGINGWKQLRGECAYIKYQPYWLWQIISDLTQILVRNRPEYAFQLLCIKTVD
ncbi:MAG: methyltransferase domain-containing protein [Thermoplasmata archaeon]